MPLSTLLREEGCKAKVTPSLDISKKCIIFYHFPGKNDNRDNPLSKSDKKGAAIAVTPLIKTNSSGDARILPGFHPFSILKFNILCNHLG